MLIKKILYSKQAKKRTFVKGVCRSQHDPRDPDLQLYGGGIARLGPMDGQTHSKGFT